MSKDFRVAATFPDHPKTVKLVRRVGDTGVVCLVRLWGYATQYRPTGVLYDMSEEDVEIAAKWSGQLGAFVGALREVRYLDDVDGTLVLHDWQEHNPFAFHSEERSEKAREAAQAKWDKFYAKRSAEQSAEHSQAERLAESSSAPSPIPSPTPKPKNKTIAPDGAFERFWSTYPKRKSKGQALKAWNKVKPNEQLQDRIFSALERAKTSADWRKDNGQFIPYPASWLNAQGWEDDHGGNSTTHDNPFAGAL